jgi:23S rRNA pseudouridine2605 synthase
VATTTTVALHKPVGYVATARDPQGRPIVSDLLAPDLRAMRLAPVGRLDVDSEGLLLLSNDGALALRLTHPRYEAEKEYHALIQGNITDEALDRLRHGVTLAGGDPRPTAPARVWRLTEAAPLGHIWVGVVIHEGRKRQIRMMFAAVGSRVTRLIRARIGRLRLADVVPEPGQTRILTPAQIALTEGGPSPSTVGEE